MLFAHKCCSHEFRGNVSIMIFLNIFFMYAREHMLKSIKLFYLSIEWPLHFTYFFLNFFYLFIHRTDWFKSITIKLSIISLYSFHYYFCFIYDRCVKYLRISINKDIIKKLIINAIFKMNRKVKIKPWKMNV